MNHQRENKHQNWGPFCNFVIDNLLTFIAFKFCNKKGLSLEVSWEPPIGHPTSICVCRNLPFGGRATRGLTGASSIGGRCAESPPTFIRGKHRKNRKRRGLRTLSVKGSGVVFTHGEGISTPHVCHKGRQPSIKCANMTSIFFIFPFTFF